VEKVTARTRAEELRRYLRRMDQSWSEDEGRGLLEVFVRLLPGTFGAERCSIFIVEPQTGQIVSRTGTGIEENEIVAPPHQSIVGRVITTGRPVIENDLLAVPGFHRTVDERTGFRTRSVLCVPVRRSGDDTVIGALQILNRRVGMFGDEDRELLCNVASFLARFIERERLARELYTVSRRIEQDLALRSCLCAGDELVAGSPAMRHLVEQARAVSELPVNILIRGENGTGKEVVARLIHDHSARCDGPFVPVNCASIPEPLVESELFGHEKGAFTGADRARRGRFEEAEDGTLFLDEIGDLPLAIQPKLLRVLQEGQGQRLGATGLRRYNFRVLCATHQDLRALVSEGRFREDLYYRLFSVELKLPPLRERGSDILVLAQIFLEETCRRFGKRIGGFSDDLVSLFESYPWPGNVRQLRNEVERLAAFTPEGSCAEVLSCSPELREAAGYPRATRPELRASMPVQVRCLEKEMILEALRSSGGNRDRAARELGISRQGLYKKLARYGLQDLHRWKAAIDCDSVPHAGLADGPPGSPGRGRDRT